MLTLQGNSKAADESLVAPLREKLLLLKLEEGFDQDEVSRFCGNDDNLCRFLVARDNHLENTYEMLAAALKWRSSVQPSCITAANFPTANAQGTWRFAGHAKNGWPIMLVRAGLWDSYAYSVEEYVMMIAFFLETNAKRMDPAATNQNGQKHFIIFDMEGMSYRSDMKKQKQLMKLANDYYPEQLGIAVIVNANFLFSAFWRCIRPWMDKATAEKVRMFKTVKDYVPFLEEHVGLENITTDLGGTRVDDWPTLGENNTE